jgi:hypothetical protein
VSAPSQATIDQFTSLDEGTQRDLLGKMSPETKGALLAALQTKDTSAPSSTSNTVPAPRNSAPPLPRPPGTLVRTAQAVGLPSSKAELQAISQPPSITDTLLGPVATAGKMVGNAAGRAMSGEPEFAEAVHNIGEGGPIGANLGKGAYAVTKAVASAIPGGEGVYNFGEDIANKNYKGAIGDALGTVINGLLLRGKGKPSTSTRVNKLGFASGGEVSAIEKTLPEIDKTIRQSGPRPCQADDRTVPGCWRAGYAHSLGAAV